MKNQLSKYFLPTLAVAYFFYLCLRAWYLPITTDEGTTWYNFVPHSVYDLLSFKDPIPNNHLLNTLLIKLLHTFLEPHQFTVRIPALLGGAAYLVAAIGIARLLDWRFWLQFLVFASLLGNHYICEFLSLARGYGMSAGYVLVAIWMGLKFLKNENVATLRWAMFWAVISVLASFTALNFFLPLCFYFFVVIFQKKMPRQFWFSVVAGIVSLAAICYFPFKRMSETDQFHFWSLEGFWKDTVLSMARGYRSGKEMFGHFTPEILGWAFLAVWFLWGIAAIWRWKKAKFSFSEPGFFGWAMLTGTAVVTILQAILIKTPYLSGRTAVIFWPMFALGVPFLVKWLSEKWMVVGRAIGIGFAFLFSFHFYNCLQLKSCQEWWFDAYTFEVLDYLKKIKDERGDGQKIRLSSYWLMNNSLNFEIDTRRSGDFEKVEWRSKSDPDDPAEFLYTEKGELPVFEKNFEIIWEVEKNGRYLLQRKR